jgi:hypothetical protein
MSAHVETITLHQAVCHDCEWESDLDTAGDALEAAVAHDNDHHPEAAA